MVKNDGQQVFKGRKIVGGKVVGEALVSPEPICFLGGVDPDTGIITEKGHPLEGKTLKDKVLIFPIGRGSTGGSYLIYATYKNGNGPLAFINLTVDSITAIGCILGEIPMVAELDPNPVQGINSGVMVEVDADKGEVKLVDS